MKPSSLTTIAAILIIGIGGFLAGRISSSHDTSPSHDNQPSTSTRSAQSLKPSNKKDELVSSNRKSQHPEHSDRSSTHSTTDRFTRLESIVRNENPIDRARAMLDLIDQLAATDFKDAIDRFRSLGLTENRLGEYGMLLSAWANTDPTAALAYAKENTQNPFATNTILSTWASNDPEAAILWAQSNHTDDQANPYFASIIRSLATTDPTRATALLTSMPRSQERGAALDAMLPHLLQQGNDAVKTWIANLTDDSLRSGAIARAANQLAQTDPAGTAALLVANPSDSAQRELDHVYGSWTYQDPQSAINSLASLPAGETRSHALRGAVTSLAMQDPHQGAALMDRFAADVTDSVVQNYVWHSLDKDPATAISQISRISNEHKRLQAYTAAINTWQEKDANAAQAWLRANPLPANVQQHLSNEIVH